MKTLITLHRGLRGRLLLPVPFLFVVFFVNAQVTTTFTYSGSGLNNTSLNVFNPAVTINSHSHSAALGGVTFSGGQLQLATTPTATSPGGTAYAINFPFTAGTTYTISISASSSDGASLLAYVYAALPSWISTSATTADPNIGQLGTGTNIGTSFSPSGSAQTFALPAFTPTSSNLNYIIIGAKGGSDDLSDLSIASVSILAVTPAGAAQFTLTPTTLALNCGDVTARTFTVTNPQNIAGTATYSWTVGAGWLFNGAAPTGPITTAGSSITLTPVNTAASPPHNISAAVSVNGTLYNTYTCTVTPANPAPALGITEVNAAAPLCSGTPQVFNLTGSPAGATVTWGITPATGIASLAPNGTQATLSYSASGSLTLGASVTNTCGTWSASYGTVVVGIPHAPTDLEGLVSTGVPPNSVCEFFSIDGTNWTLTNATIFAGQGTHDIGARVANIQSGTVTVKVTASNACGTSAALTRSAPIVPGSPNPPRAARAGSAVKAGSMPVPDLLASPAVYPNPATSSIQVTIPATENTNTRIRIYTIGGRLLRTILPHASSTQVDVSQLAKGTYLVEMDDGKTTTTQKLVKQ
jgi:hypothetical protein